MVIGYERHKNILAPILSWNFLSFYFMIMIEDIEILWNVRNTYSMYYKVDSVVKFNLATHFEIKIIIWIGSWKFRGKTILEYPELHDL